MLAKLVAISVRVVLLVDNFANLYLKLIIFFNTCTPIATLVVDLYNQEDTDCIGVLSFQSLHKSLFYRVNYRQVRLQLKLRLMVDPNEVYLRPNENMVCSEGIAHDICGFEIVFFYIKYY